MDDESLMPIPGKFFGERMIDVPAWYLISLIRGGNTYGELKAYLDENEDAITLEYNQEKK